MGHMHCVLSFRSDGDRLESYEAISDNFVVRPRKGVGDYKVDSLELSRTYVD